VWNSAKNVGGVTYSGLNAQSPGIHLLNNLLVDMPGGSTSGSGIAIPGAWTNLTGLTIRHTAYLNSAGTFSEATEGNRTLNEVDLPLHVGATRSQIESWFAELTNAVLVPPMSWTNQRQRMEEAIDNLWALSVTGSTELAGTGEAWAGDGSLDIGPWVASPVTCSTGFLGLLEARGLGRWNSRGHQERLSPTGRLHEGYGDADYEGGRNTSLGFDTVIQPANAAVIHLTFDTFDLGSGDTLTVYEGTTNTPPVGGPWTGTQAPGSLSITGQTVVLTFRTDNDASVGAGYDIRYTTTVASGNSYGVPASWLTTHGLGPDQDATVIADPDGDGSATWREFIADTDPTNEASVLAFHGILQDSNGWLRLLFPASTQRHYTVQATPAPDRAPWTAAGPPAPSPEDGLKVNPTNAAGMYHLRVTLPP
jgi:hypothetical protein